MIKLLICSYYAALLNIIYYILANYLLLSISSKEIWIKTADSGLFLLLYDFFAISLYKKHDLAGSRAFAV